MFSFHHSNGSPLQPHKQLIFPKSERRYLSTGWSTYMQYSFMVLASIVCMWLDGQKQKRKAKCQLVHFGTHPLGSVVLILYLVAVCCPMLYDRFCYKVEHLWSGPCCMKDIDSRNYTLCIQNPLQNIFPVICFFFFALCWEGLFVSCFGLNIVVCVCLALCVGSTSPILSLESVQVESVPLPKIHTMTDSRMFSH